MVPPAAGAGGASELEPPAPVPCQAVEEVAFVDPVVETAVRSALGVDAQTGLSPEVLSQLRDLSIDQPGTMSLEGVECLTGLENLVIFNGTFTDLSPLSSLERLRALYLAEGQLTDLSPLAHLEQLDWLYLDQNLVVDVTPLAGLTKLYNLSLLSNRIEDVTPLLALDALGELLLAGNPVDCNDDEQRLALETLESRVTQGPFPPVPPDRMRMVFFDGPCPRE